MQGCAPLGCIELVVGNATSEVRVVELPQFHVVSLTENQRKDLF